MLLIGVTAAIATALSLVALVQIWQNHLATKRRCEMLEDEILQLREQLSRVNRGSIGVGQRLMQIENKLNDLEKHHAAEETASEHLPYRQAQQMLDQGMDVNQLKQRFGLSDAELALMRLVNSKAGQRDPIDSVTDPSAKYQHIKDQQFA